MPIKIWGFYFMPKNGMTREAASRIQSAACKAGSGVVKSGSFAARAMSAAYKNEPISEYTGISQVLVKIGIFAAVGSAIYYNRDAIVDYVASCFIKS